MTRKLTQKQETFCRKYFEIGNATEAAIMAGYSKHTACVIASENLTKPNICERLYELNQLVEDATVATVLERKQRLTEIMRANIPDFISEEGIKVNNVMPNVGAVAEITSKTKVFRRGGEPILITNLKLHNPIPAIAELNKMEKIYEIVAPVEIDNRTLNIYVTSDRAKKLLEEIEEGVLPHGSNDDQNIR